MDFEYFGDNYLKFHDYVNSMSLKDVIECQINLNIPFILPNEFAYYINAKDNLLKTLKFVKECQNEPDQSKHIKIMEKYGLKPKDVPAQKLPDYLK